MRTLALGIVGIFGLGLAVGSFVAARTAGGMGEVYEVRWALSRASAISTA